MGASSFCWDWGYEQIRSLDKAKRLPVLLGEKRGLRLRIPLRPRMGLNLSLKLLQKGDLKWLRRL